MYREGDTIPASPILLDNLQRDIDEILNGDRKYT